MVCFKRLEENFQRLSTIGKQDGGGFTRLAFGDADWEARNVIIELMKTAGLTIRVDAFGNVIGRREGLYSEKPVVMLGSHIDTVPNGGNFDGVLGVLGAIEALQCLEEQQEQNEHPIEVVVFMAEESSRFGVATLGSKAFCGKLSPEKLVQYKDKDGISLGDAMQQRELNPANIRQAQYQGDIKAFLELHIEQGKVLETTKHQIGIVTGIAAPTRFKAIVTGQADHSGATPMNMRQDALTAAAEVILLVEQLARKVAHLGVVGTTGVIKAEPGAMNVIPGRVELGIDIRAIQLASKQWVVDELIAGIDKIKAQRSVEIEMTTLTDETPVELLEEMVEVLQDVCKQHPYPNMLMPSGAGHDAMHLASLAPTGIIFIPCQGGISHNPAESASMDDIVAGTEILLTAIRKIAKVDFSWKKQ
ncbi:Zn-dependent hydrolase [Pelosinus propionicus]|uniref:N-carbamoyl-L-amino-acid hydrolase n=1 Tax=Pelosinus propionicus DSM 13327 TaxID=1123291 RepID=A0A1I4GMS1_9FIRM|nr:Zn-dependent hydrolase [Pelosinus propionicus]SFL30687.1 N-carbamoyl-L-amino-acid hydrolase [Pelosinus propionicus DSM 13327]